LGLSVWCEDEAGPFQAVPHPGVSWQPRRHPAIQPHEYVRGGTTKILTLFHPASGQVRLSSAERCTNAVLHPWLRERLTAILAELPAPAARDPAITHAAWEVWQAGWSCSAFDTAGEFTSGLPSFQSGQPALCV
jgi:hypothetical protein